MVIILDISVGGSEWGRRVNIIWSLHRIFRVDIYYIIYYYIQSTDYPPKQ